MSIQGATKEDFTTVTILKKTQAQLSKESKGVRNTIPSMSETSKKAFASKNVQRKNDLNMSLIDNEVIKPPVVTHEMGKQIQKKRCEMKLTQEQLAQKCNLGKDIIRDYENGKAIAKRQDLTKINKALGLRLSMPKPEKITE